jgi:hypothetical protein
MKHSVSLISFRAFEKRTLAGFATVRIDPLRLIIHDVALHRKGTARWAQLPARPFVRDGVHVVENGKPQYATTLEFEGGRPVRDSFSLAVWNAVLAAHPDLADEGVT